ncbi:MAG: TIGR00645 family protein [Methylobacteriaceae bacterium]|nr:TIGR00645 family protein [Methylobacteriaceae bacterium]
MIERAIEKILFASRWLLAPFFIALALSLLVLLLKMGHAFYEFALHAWSGTESDTILGILGLIDLTLTGSLIVIVIFSGYENFVSRIEAADHADWPEWMAKIDFTGLKLKLLSSIVAISAIQLLRGFMDVKNTTDRELWWYVVIHLVFVASGLVLALTDRLSEHQPGQSA